MRENKKRKPAPIFHDKQGRTRLPSWAISYFSPVITEHVRYSDEVEAAMRYGDLVMKSAL